MIARPYDRPDLDQARYAPALYVTGALISGKPMLAYEGRLQIHNAIGACTAEQIDGDTLPNGSAIYVDQATSEVVVAWPAYAETGAAALNNPGFEAGNLTGWDVVTIGQQGTPPNHIGVTTSRPYAGSYCSHYAGQKGVGHAGGIEAQWLNTKRAACYPQKKITAAIKVSFDDTTSSQNRGRARLVFFDGSGNPIQAYDGNLIKGNSEAWQDSSLTQAAPEGTRSVGMGAWVTSNQSGAVRLDAATWDAPDIVGTAVAGVFNLTIRVRDSAGRVYFWIGQVIITPVGWSPADLAAMNWFDAKLSSYGEIGPDLLPLGWENLGSNGGYTSNSYGPPSIQPNGMMGRDNNNPWQMSLPESSNFVPVGNVAYFMAVIAYPVSDSEGVFVRQGPGTDMTTPHLGVRPTSTSEHNNYSADLYGQTGSVTLNAPNIFVATYDGAFKRTFVNGVQDAFVAQTNLNTQGGTNWLGGYSQFGASLVGQIGTIATGPGPLSTEDRQKLEGYLAWHWQELGAVAMLPSGHPYKSAPP
ncbi:hypothetical protein [Pseudoxanthomonas sp. X-1]|uniref:hypothetical protein n=1 Tax=Pseudoxanthomonas sp. X-1 TaxID=2571115 RepID=UPI00110A5B2A|nr:hypothetical protein [Pseudoxanthomonas sp. X-1]TMN24493.1 hypothetical protein FF950_05275 [Pseudoxanthomonas sp. X-1]UAY75241.1 hypothetical protein LAJ50_02955 [Pseudoxanthomonas sp. X-1]